VVHLYRPWRPTQRTLFREQVLDQFGPISTGGIPSRLPYAVHGAKPSEISCEWDAAKDRHQRVLIGSVDHDAEPWLAVDLRLVFVEGLGDRAPMLGRERLGE
jgi:hypothetical protein